MEKGQSDPHNGRLSVVFANAYQTSTDTAGLNLGSCRVLERIYAAILPLCGGQVGIHLLVSGELIEPRHLRSPGRGSRNGQEFVAPDRRAGRSHKL